MKVLLWHSNSPLCNSGYAGQTALFVPRIAAMGYEVAISAPFSFAGAPLEWNGHIVEGAVRDVHGNDILAARYAYHNAGLLITLCDPFGLIGCARQLAGLNTVMWFPVDCDPLGEADVTVLRDSQAIPIAMSRFGQRVIEAEGADPLFVPHGVDTALFSPGDPGPYREAEEIGPETFVIGINAMNRDKLRKGFSEQMMAFAAFHEQHPDSILAVHAAAVAQPGLNLAGGACRLGIADAVKFPDDYALASSLITAQQLVTWYRGLDILSSCSYGEGFGLPVLEAQSAGIPVVVTDCSALNELCGAGWLVSGTPFMAPEHGAMWVRPDVADIADAYEKAWQARENGELPKAQARAFALQYDADLVALEFWQPALKEIEARLGDRHG